MATRVGKAMRGGTIIDNQPENKRDVVKGSGMSKKGRSGLATRGSLATRRSLATRGSKWTRQQQATRANKSQ